MLGVPGYFSRNRYCLFSSNYCCTSSSSNTNTFTKRD